jgi:hypothetical protein
MKLTDYLEIRFALTRMLRSSELLGIHRDELNRLMPRRAFASAPEQKNWPDHQCGQQARCFSCMAAASLRSGCGLSMGRIQP